ELARAHSAVPARAPSPAAAPAPAPDRRAARVADNSRASDLFATHSWYVPPPPPPAAPVLPPPAPTAPPFPYTIVGSFAPDGEKTVYFLARGDRVTDAHVGDRIDGVYLLESAQGGQLTFNYLPLDIRQVVATGAPL
ncbi:MAG: hypothetical protein JSR54_17320, partial [Proteobacteria bacterium]|nr:hypothetical protein [Pseudomonadota bacterium]